MNERVDSDLLTAPVPPSTWPSTCCGASPATSAAPSSTSCVSSSVSPRTRCRSSSRSTACRRSSRRTPNWCRCIAMARRDDHGNQPAATGTRRAHVAAAPDPQRRHRPPRGRHDPGRRSQADRADHPRSAVPHLPRVPHADEASIPRTDDPPLGRSGCGRRRADRVRPNDRDRRLRHRSGPRVVVPHGVESALGADAPSAPDLRRDYGLGAGPVIVSRRSPTRTRAIASCSR